MKIRRKLLPGQPGTKKLAEKFGEDLVCVRYRYDAKRKRKIKTVELIIEESSWEVDTKRIPPNKITHIRVNYGEVELGKRIKAAGGKWNKEKRLWELPYKHVMELGLKDRMVIGEQ